MAKDSDFQKFSDFIDECADERIEQIGQELMTNPKYREVKKQKALLFGQICNALPREAKVLLANYEELENEVYSIQRDFFYYNAFKDALMLMKLWIL